MESLILSKPYHGAAPSWTQWSDQFQSAITAKKNLDNDSLNGPEVTETQTPILERATGMNWTLIDLVEKRGKKNSMKKSKPPKRSVTTKKKNKFNDIRRAEAEKKLRSI